MREEIESCDKEMNELKWILNVLEQGHVSKFNDIVKKLGCMQFVFDIERL